MFSSAEMTVVETLGSPKRLNSSSVAARMRSAVRRGAFLAMASGASGGRHRAAGASGAEAPGAGPWLRAAWSSWSSATRAVLVKEVKAPGGVTLI